MVDVIRRYAANHNLIYGICNAADLDIEAYGDICNIPFFHGNGLDRISPKRFLDNAGSVIVIGAGIELKPIIQGLEHIMAPSLSGEDYHKKLRVKAEGLVQAMLEEATFNYKIQVDSGPLMEIAFAEKAKLGFVGRNKSLISEKFGAFFNIGLIVADVEIENAHSHNDKCLCSDSGNSQKCPTNCRKCSLNCPTKALGNAGDFDYEKCISYLTQKKGSLSKSEMKAIGVSIYGCDICRNTCPYNPGMSHEEGHFTQKKELLIKILNMGKSQFEKTFANSNFLWRGKTTIQRNCLIALYNLCGAGSIDIIEKYCESTNEVLRLSAERLIEMAKEDL